MLLSDGRDLETIVPQQRRVYLGSGFQKVQIHDDRAEAAGRQQARCLEQLRAQSRSCKQEAETENYK